ncbi:MAG: hypothetical protein IT330_09055 [Anaerolineae bacterium]|nr:hypothetical protein [Anaerolineae bacterium]
MSEQRRDEKEEKQEKEEEKDEKQREEKWRRDPLSAIVWAAILIWAGIVFLGENMGLLANLSTLEAWSLVFIGAGIIVLLEVVVRILIPEYRRPVTGSIIFAFILLAIGLGNTTGWDLIWPLILIAIGAAILLGGFLRRR